MKLVINQSGVKRRLDNKPLELCLDRDTLKTLRDRLNEIDLDSFHYGWITIYETPIVDPAPNTQPLNWTDK